MPAKICSICKVEKDYLDFYKKSSSKLGISSSCQVCIKQKEKDKYDSNPKHKRTIANASFHRNKETALARQAKYRTANPGSGYSRVKEWRKTNQPKRNAEARRRRALIKGNGHTAYSEQEVLNLYGASCHICETAIDLLAPRSCGKNGWEMGLHIDHVIPIASGGADDIGNVKPAHGKCNIVKGASIIIEAESKRLNS